MRFTGYCLAVLVVVSLVSGCGSQSEADVLSPDQVTTEMVDQEVRVKGRITLAVENPGGLGGIYLTLGDEEIGVRIQEDIWAGMNEEEQAGFMKGKTATVEGVLFLAGKQLVVRYGLSPP
ncbi:MAG: hypothetical protein V3S02_00020 [Dehalococcoidales bacterium]